MYTQLWFISEIFCKIFHACSICDFTEVFFLACVPLHLPKLFTCQLQVATTSKRKMSVDATFLYSNLVFSISSFGFGPQSFHTNTVFWWIPFRWAIKISGVREITIAQVSASTTIVSRSGPMMGKGNKTRVPRKRKPILKLNLSRRGKDPGLIPSGGNTDILLSPVAATPDFTLVFFHNTWKTFSCESCIQCLAEL